MANYAGTLAFADAAKAKMEEKGIKEDDVRAVIGAAEETGEKMRNADATLFVAKLKIEQVWVNAVYKPADDGFEVADVYTHGSDVTGW